MSVHMEPVLWAIESAPHEYPTLVEARFTSLAQEVVQLREQLTQSLSERCAVRVLGMAV
ncbi:MAG: hypothetical protein ACRDTC_24930 [Pseudonocardiaceae bacterium]